VLGFRDLLLYYVVTGFSLRWVAVAAAAGSVVDMNQILLPTSTGGGREYQHTYALYANGVELDLSVSRADRDWSRRADWCWCSDYGWRHHLWWFGPHPLDHAGRGVADGGHRDARAEVEEPAALDVPDIGALGPLDEVFHRRQSRGVDQRVVSRDLLDHSHQSGLVPVADLPAAALAPQRDESVEVLVQEGAESPSELRSRFPWARFTVS